MSAAPVRQAATAPGRHRCDRAAADRQRVDDREDHGALYEVCGTKVSRDTISRIPDKVVKEMIEYQNRSLGNQPINIAIGRDQARV